MFRPAMARRSPDRNALIPALLEDPLGRLIGLPFLALETSARFLRERTILASMLSGGGLAIAISARNGWIEPPIGMTSEGLVVAGVLGLMTTLWLLEVIPVAATALLPLVLFPLLGVAPAKEVALAWGDSTILLLLGAFMLARGVERWGVPAVLGGLIDRWAEGSPRKTVVGLVVVTTVLGAWLSNTATALVMVTVAMSAIKRAEEGEPDRPDEVRRFKVALLLSIAFSCSIGGMQTPVASPPNLVVMGLMGEHAPSFLQWMAFALPLVAVAMPLMVWLLVYVVCPFDPNLRLAPANAGEHAGGLGPAGWRAVGVFAGVVVLWLTRVDLQLGALRIPGWSSALGLQGMVDDSTVAIAGALVMFMAPSGLFVDAVREVRSEPHSPDDERRPTLARALEALSRDRLLNWEWAREIPWNLLLLFGGGLALASAFETTGLGAWLGGQIASLGGIPVWAMVVVLAVGVSALTEVASSTAVASIVLPVVLVVAQSLELPPLALMWPAAFATSASFLFPISTPPNAIVAGAGDLSFGEMARAGFIVKIVVLGVVVAGSLFWLPVVMRIR